MADPTAFGRRNWSKLTKKEKALALGLAADLDAEDKVWLVAGHLAFHGTRQIWTDKMTEQFFDFSGERLPWFSIKIVALRDALVLLLLLFVEAEG